MEAKDLFDKDWRKYQAVTDCKEECAGDVISANDPRTEEFVRALVNLNFDTQKGYDRALRDLRRRFKVVPGKPAMQSTYMRLRAENEIDAHPWFEKLGQKKNVRSNSGVVVITLVLAPGRFSCPNDCHYCPNEPGQPRSYLSTEPAVLRANQNKFDPVLQFWDRARVLAKQGHPVDKVEIIVLGGTWSSYPRDYQEEWCRDMFYAANTFSEQDARLAAEPYIASTRERKSLLEEQGINEKANTKIIGVTLETRPDHINKFELRRLRRYGCTRVQIGVQHTDDEVLDYINRGHNNAASIKAIRLLKECCFKVDIHLMPDLPTSDPEKDWAMFQEVLFGPDLQADHWKIYPCSVTPFSIIEQWYEEGKYMPYTDRDPDLLLGLLVRVKACVHPWIRLNRVIRDIPVESIIGGNQNTNLRQAVFAELAKRNQSCRCIRCREVRDWPEEVGELRIRVRHYRSSHGDELFMSAEGQERGSGGGATQRALGPQSAAGKDRKKKGIAPGALKAWEESITAREGVARELGDEETLRALREEREKLDEKRPRSSSKAPAPTACYENAALYGLLRLRFNDDPKAAAAVFPELDGCALIRELHVYGQLIASRPGEGKDERPQHRGVGTRLMMAAESIAFERGYRKIAVIAGVGVRNFYRRLGYELRGDGQYLVKDLRAGVTRFGKASRPERVRDGESFVTCEPCGPLPIVGDRTNLLRTAAAVCSAVLVTALMVSLRRK
jgi:ELP3 family radical SAM enzyme/protein acetyltransferase